MSRLAQWAEQLGWEGIGVGRALLIGALVCTGFFSPTLSTKAAVTTLSGGNPGEGWTAPQSKEVILAGNVLHLGALTESTNTPVIQGIAFLAMDDPSFPTNRAYLTGAYQQNWSLKPSLGASANNDELKRILQTGVNPAGSYTLHLEQLVPNRAYRLDLLAFTDTTSTNNSVAFVFNGTVTNSFDEVAGTAYVVSEKVTADGSGKITVEVQQVLPLFNSTPFLNAFVLSPVP